MRSSWQCRPTPICISWGYRGEKRNKQTLSVVCCLSREQSSSCSSCTNLHFTTNKNKGRTCPPGAHISTSKEAAKLGNSIKLEDSLYHSLRPRFCPQRKNWELPERKLVQGKGKEGWVKKDVLSFSPPLVCFVLFCFFTEGKKMWEGCSMKKS